MKRVWINIILVLTAAYGSIEVLQGKSYMPQSWQYFAHLIAPWVLLFGSLKAWHRCFVWRRMTADKHIMPHLSRGQSQPPRPKQRAGVLEHGSMILFLTAVAATLTQLGIKNTTFLIHGMTALYFVLHVVSRVIR